MESDTTLTAVDLVQGMVSGLYRHLDVRPSAEQAEEFTKSLQVVDKAVKDAKVISVAIDLMVEDLERDYDYKPCMADAVKVLVTDHLTRVIDHNVRS